MAGLKVLAIEDDRDTQANLCDILELDGFHVETASSMTEALSRKDWPEFTAILLDRKLPDGTAEELLPQLKQLAPEAATIIVTGYADIESAIAALRHGATDYILKPINADALRASLMRVAEIKQAKQLAAEAQQRALQAERLAAIGQMLAVLAHESRNALQRVQACAEMLALDLQDRPELLELALDIQRSQDRLHSLFEDLRNYAAPVPLNRERSELGEILEEAWVYLSKQRNGRATLLTKDADGLDLHCHVDRHRIGQVFRNVLENSLAACGNPVEIAARWSETTIDGKPALRVQIRDNGPGLAAEHKRLIFEPFFTTKSTGTGLGMAISKRIIEAHGGTITVGDNSSPGAEIEITLPRGVNESRGAVHE